MCGIHGLIRLRPDAPALDDEELERTSTVLARRGPDGAGNWRNPDGTVAFGHRRLAIIDLSPGGAQPMCSADGRFTITFNGEIYNYRELRAALPDGGAGLRTQSDTEVIMAWFALEGERAFGRLRGMFALALWDETRRRLTLARDPLGIKPLYYALDRSTGGATLRFASQVRAVLAGGAVAPALDPAGIVGFLLWGSVPEPHTWLRAVRAVPAGSLIEIADGEVGEPRRYRVETGPPAADLATALADSVRAHFVADVPVGLFLSAGLDSSLLAALARRVTAEPPLAFTLAFAPFRGGPQDEAPLARRTAALLGLPHVVREIDREEFRALWDAHLEAMDQPSIDGFNTYLVSRLAREAGLKVVLSGVGGDELFGSYPSFHDVPRWRRRAAWAAALPGARAAWPTLAATLAPGLPKLAGMLAHGTSTAGAYFLRRALFLPDEVRAILPRDLAEEGLAEYDPVADAQRQLDDRSRSDAWRAVHRLETNLYMRNQLLRDSDWASLAHGLELRTPLVDAHLAAAVEALGFEPARSRGKRAAVALAAPELPRELLERRKSGFALPMEWVDDGKISPDDTGGPSATPGIRSRRRALRLVEQLGVALRENAAS